VMWPGGQYAVVKNPPVDTMLYLNQADASLIKSRGTEFTKPIYKDVTSLFFKGNIRHTENEYIDFKREKLIPKMISTEGPKLAFGDVNGDGLEDFYMGNAFADTAKIFIQQPDGHYVQ